MIWHILKKDLSCLALPAAATLVLLVVLTVLDVQRFDYESGLLESVLNVLLPLAWAVLICLGVHLEPLTSDTAFWLTRPYRRTALFMAKLAFAVLTIHIPLLVAHAVILGSHGFAFLSPVLWWKQLAVLLGVTVPALAMASVTSTLAAFGWSALSALAIALLLDLALTGRRYPWVFSEWTPVASALLLLFIGGTVILGIQYTKRTRWTGRILGLVVAVAGVLVYSYLPRDLAAAWQCAIDPDPPSSLTATLDPERNVRAPQVPVHPGRAVLALPLRVAGLEPTWTVWAEQLSVRLTGPAGQAWKARRTLSVDRRAWWSLNPADNLYLQMLTPDRSFLGSVADGPVRLQGRASIRPFREGEVRVLPVVFGQTDMPGLGRCSSQIQVEFFGREILKVVCESTHPMSPTRVILVDPANKRDWKQGLGDSVSGFMPKFTWLSPLERRQTFLHIAEQDSRLPGERGMVPRDVLKRAQIRIETAVPQGCANVDYSFEVRDLTRWQASDR
jgi:hypothetical protein